jgi:hypothetical protein
MCSKESDLVASNIMATPVSCEKIIKMEKNGNKKKEKKS